MADVVSVVGVVVVGLGVIWCMSSSGGSLGVRLVGRDYEIFKEVSRWRVSLGRHIRVLVGFRSERSCDRRLRKLIDAGYLGRTKLVYGVPSIYYLTNQAKKLINVKSKQEKFRLEQIVHDVAVLDSAIYMLEKYQITRQDITTDKQLHSQDGFGNRKHYPDFIFRKDSKIYAIEIELSLKSKNRFENNVKFNYTNYDYQIWIVPKEELKIIKLLEEFSMMYPNINIINLEEVNIFVQSNRKNNDTE